MNSFSPEIQIGSCLLGEGHRTFVIAEIGVNHDGSAEKAIELVQHAADAGADAVKLQVFRARDLMHPSSAFAEYQRDRVSDADPIAMLERFELSDRQLRQIIAAARDANLIPLATPFSLPDVERIVRLDLPAIKIASPDIVNRPLLHRAALTGRPLIVSTGAATMAEVRTSVNWLQNWSAPLALLHCVSSYPVAPMDTNLCWIGELAGEFNVPTGFSDHTTDPFAGALAVAAGACVIEKHLTYDKSAPGPDHSASADPAEFKQYIRAIRSAALLRGKPGKHVIAAERDVQRASRQSLVTTRRIESGQVIAMADLTVQRPGTGIAASEIELIVGRRSRIPIAAGTMLEPSMLADLAEAHAA